MSEFLFNHNLSSFMSNASKWMQEIEEAERQHAQVLAKINKKYSSMLGSVNKMQVAQENILRQERAKVKKELKQAQARIRELEEIAPHADADAASLALEQSAIKKACSLAVFDSILFGMEEWSAIDPPASDFRLISQSLIFKVVYEPIMQGESDYYLEQVPVAALEIVRRGREYISSIRERHTAAMTDPRVWEQVQEVIHEWWINDALPLLYGARDDSWIDIEPYTLDEMLAWRDQPASRALDFALVWDGSELVNKYGDQIRETTGIGEFQNKHMHTRLTPQ